MNLNNYALWTAVVTPLLENSTVDFESLTRVVNEQDSSDNGLLILGSTAEALNLNLAQRMSIIEHVVKMKPASPIMVGVGGNLLEEQKEWITYLERLNVHAYLLVTPHYAKPGPIGQYNWFKALMDHSTRPCMLYNVPGRTAVAMSTEAVSRLSNHRNFWAIKEASGSVEKFKEYLKAAGGKAVYCGDDALMPDFANAGSAGLVSVASNAWPKETHLYVEQCLKKTFDAKELWTKASNSLFVCSNPVPVKRLLAERGVIRTPVMMAPLSHEDMTSATPVLEAHAAVTRWYKEVK
ncbi:4-hydroxy-tetrahydrodipicolinate synthase [Peredibacter starrii]|uniref:4-hydroxy-tetrahydrodipicolinate synthase n=1 Tax=Peredibacter starrii TaxID=28202 RepID=A0AAX4HJR0_9BACT|nr:4-hydroxy-tetrahydrodipicolinate synthase [Peredibacter starrii]WPU63421.1 4-hydroxy-tetrahydrodipicolinate synthase [Peredibacter starrii]